MKARPGRQELENQGVCFIKERGGGVVAKLIEVETTRRVWYAASADCGGNAKSKVSEWA